MCTRADRTFDFSALTLLVERHEERSACKNWVMTCWCCHLSEQKCRSSAYGVHRCHCHPIIYCSIKIQTGLIFLVPAYCLPRLSWKNRPLNRCLSHKDRKHTHHLTVCQSNRNPMERRPSLGARQFQSIIHMDRPAPVLTALWTVGPRERHVGLLATVITAAGTASHGHRLTDSRGDHSAQWSRRYQSSPAKYTQRRAPSHGTYCSCLI